ncbi:MULTISPECIES: CDP-diacylglycerol--glycerol-3-phosphate 3-phosphatidyltransferase [Gordonia]|uniref:CDP-diacylglycerol--glycerol-3-phosphate 3-phosphatidyltransferase n=1 Tax=Gordonia amicalis TaxID=89053 RepID=A0AAE4U6N3_9ACTN|nr:MULTISPECIES: CDP-diacylglycerol--glycerol-3-phosphate 3-phosphatidyltransferase [Gordonia]ATD73012.1 CDP-diacylglycerol--glycerol-3-phosphate 3-phosphatidyltransferase [Gordonia sp. 1D]KAF0970737.1 CDP-diacylglycerol--glycerol-3-phosphate 3-phosphatidyltransferase [Gordonia sp. YY1]MCR8895541.1 CDP-diacylglycerol--glycerol-3-phosphate 3-phosphatidyltransferase [Gordonia sp. GONU]MCZ0913443.1 CDP-diacylglycerol--glycerol-3-phosphate 3-phosphatidyltransferase [Gordonia amicalis]MCZ4577677.1 
MTDRIRRAVDEKGIANVGRGPDHITDPVDPVPVVNIANALTVFRILLVPVFLTVLFLESGESTLWRTVATVVFAVAALTDRYDGRIARERGLITDFGKMADPIADKALIGGALVGLSILGILPWWVTAVIIARELWVTALRFWVLRHKVIPASRGGKLKTLLQAVAIGLYLAPLGGGWDIAAGIVMGLAVVVTIYTGLDYTWQAIKVRSAGGSRPGTPDPEPAPQTRRAVGGTGAGR